MAKTVSIPLTANDIAQPKPQMKSAGLQRGVVPSAELVPIQFRMTPDFVRNFKQAALDRDMKLNEFLNVIFHDFMKTAKNENNKA